MKHRKKLVDEVWGPAGEKKEEPVRPVVVSESTPSTAAAIVERNPRPGLERSQSPDSDHTRPYSLGPDDVRPEESRVPEKPAAVRPVVAQKANGVVGSPHRSINTVRTSHMKPQNNSFVNKNMSGSSTLELSRSRSPNSKSGINKSVTAVHFKSAKEKTLFYNTLVHVQLPYKTCEHK